MLLRTVVKVQERDEWREGVGVEPTRDVYSPIPDLKSYLASHKVIDNDRKATDRVCDQIVANPITSCDFVSWLDRPLNQRNMQDSSF